MEILILCVVIGLIPAWIAKSKGRSFGVWWLYGAALFIVALPHALIMKTDRKSLEERQVIEEGRRKCPFCAELVKEEAKVCRFCGRDLEPVANISGPCRQCGQVVAADLDACPHCGRAAPRFG